MSYYGQYPFNTNGGSILSKRNYINRKLDEIEQTLLQLGWIEPEQETEEIINEYNIPVESAGALLPYRDKVNKRLDFFEEVINSHISPQNTAYTPYKNDAYPKQRYYTPEQEEVKKSFNESVNDLFG